MWPYRVQWSANFSGRSSHRQRSRQFIAYLTFLKGTNHLAGARMSSRIQEITLWFWGGSGPDRFSLRQSDRLAIGMKSGRDIGVLEATSRTPGRPLLVTGRARQPPTSALSKGRPWRNSYGGLKRKRAAGQVNQTRHFRLFYFRKSRLVGLVYYAILRRAYTGKMYRCCPRGTGVPTVCHTQVCACRN